MRMLCHALQYLYAFDHAAADVVISQAQNCAMYLAFALVLLSYHSNFWDTMADCWQRLFAAVLPTYGA